MGFAVLMWLIVSIDVLQKIKTFPHGYVLSVFYDLVYESIFFKDIYNATMNEASFVCLNSCK